VAVFDALAGVLTHVTFLIGGFSGVYDASIHQFLEEEHDRAYDLSV
jgi:hypothetical protein